MSEQTMDYPWDDLLESEPWRVDDKNEWKRLEELRVMRAQGSSMLTTRDKQDEAMHELHLHSHPCWLCGQSNMYYFAQGRVKVPYDAREFHCVRCGVSLKHVVPLLDTRPWFWGRPSDISPSTVIHHAELWQEREVQAGLPTLSEHLEKQAESGP